MAPPHLLLPSQPPPPPTPAPPSPRHCSPGGHGFVEGFLKSWGVILASEIGDKTFFIAAVMAMRHSRTTVSGGTLLRPRRPRGV